MRDASPVSGGASNVASRAPLERATQTVGCRTAGEQSYGLPRDVPFFERQDHRNFVGAAKGDDADFLPIKSAGLVIFFEPQG